MKKFLFILLPLVVAMSQSCKKDSTTTNNNSGSVATPCFTSSISSVNIGESVSFNSCSVNASTYKWEFGDGSESTSNGPDHSYGTAGTFTVKLTVYDSLGKPASTTKTITVTNPLTAIAGNWNFTETAERITNPNLDTVWTYNVTISTTSGQLTITNLGYFHKTFTTANALDANTPLYYLYFDGTADVTTSATQNGSYFETTNSGHTLYFQGSYTSPVLPFSNTREYSIVGTKL